METIKTFIEGIKAKDIADIFISIAILVIFFVLSIWLPRLLLKIWKVNEKDKPKKLQRWQKISEVAAKQCGRNIIPKIKPILNLKNICNMLKEYDIVLLAYEKEEKITIKQELNNLKNLSNEINFQLYIL